MVLVNITKCDHPTPEQRERLDALTKRLAPKITQKQVKDGLKTETFHLDRHDHSYFLRSTDVLGGSVSFTESKFNGPGAKRSFRATWYNGNPSHRWTSDTFDTLKEAVAYANKHRQEAVDASAKELGEDFLTEPA